jgi:flagellar biosynthesis/type III secretory pathway protein FliH
LPGVIPSATELPLWELRLPMLHDLVAPVGEAADPAERDGSRSGPSSDPDDGAAAREDLRRAWDEVVARAQVRADEIVAAAADQAGAVRDQARREGLAEFVELQLAAFREVAALVSEDLARDFEARWARLELEAARLCVDLAANVVRKVIPEDDQVVVETVREGLGRIPAARAVTIHVSPECQAALTAAVPALAHELAYGVALDVQPSDAISPGGAVLQSANGEVDLQIETQLERLREAAVAAIEREASKEAHQ